MYYHDSVDNNGNIVQKTFNQDRLDGSNSNSFQSQSYLQQQMNHDPSLTSSYLSDANDFSLHSSFLKDNLIQRFNINNNNSNNNSSSEWDFTTPTHNSQSYSTPQNIRQQDSPRLGYPSQPFLERQEQEILFSDPSFIRQQQFLQNQQRAMQMRIDQEENEHKKDHIDLPPCSRSNLTAMFDSPVSSTAHAETSSLKALDSHQLSCQLSTSQSNAQIHDESSNINDHFNSLDNNTIRISNGNGTSNGNSNGNANINRRSQPPTSNNNRTNPIPIGTPPTGDSFQISSSVPTEIDHRRRFNELQARFRVNYPRKPQKKKGTTAPAHVSASFTDSPSNFGQVQSYTPDFSFGTSMPTLGQDTHPPPAQPQAHQLQGQDTQFFNSSTDAQQANMERRVSLDGRPFSEQTPRRGSVGEKGGIPIPFDAQGSQSIHATSFPSRTMPIQIQRIQRGGMSQPFDAEQHQRRLDDQLEKANFEDITVSELKDMLRQRGRPATGKKAVLLQRLQDERDNIQAARSGRAQRFSQPPPASRRIGEFSRPKSFQGTSPMMSANTPQSPLFSSSPSSVPNTSFLPGSPGLSFSLHRSIANMHIGSPPASLSVSVPSPQQSSSHTRRFSPYGAPSSPRLASPSPKLQPQIQMSGVASLPDTASSPVSPSFGGFPSLGPSSTISSRRRAYPSSSPMTLSIGSQGGFSNRRRSYAPFTSSALATPDREDDNPFETMTEPINHVAESICDESVYDGTEQINMEGMEWLDPSLEYLVQQAYAQSDNTIGPDFLQGATHEDIMAFLADQDISYDLGTPVDHIKIEEPDSNHHHHHQNGFDFDSFGNMNQGSYQHGGW
ncbi:hypothetical protein F4703DRAFT_1891483 [Phycomyces blakesleeanus]